MNLALDSEGRFILKSAPLGWELVSGKKTLAYCRDHVEALRCMGEELRVEADAEGVDQVIESLSSVEAAITGAGRVFDIAEGARKIKVVIECAQSRKNEDRKDLVRACILAHAGCGYQEFRARKDRKQLAAEAKAILRAWGI